jgi:hypothetical protein
MIKNNYRVKIIEKGNEATLYILQKRFLWCLWWQKPCWHGNMCGEYYTLDSALKVYEKMTSNTVITYIPLEDININNG